MSKSSSKYCEGTVSIQNTYQVDEVISKFFSQKHVYEPIANPIVNSNQGTMVQAMKEEYNINQAS